MFMMPVRGNLLVRDEGLEPVDEVAVDELVCPGVRPAAARPAPSQGAMQSPIILSLVAANIVVAGVPASVHKPSPVVAHSIELHR